MSLGQREVCIPTASGWSRMRREIYKVEQRRMPRYSRVLYHQKGTRTERLPTIAAPWARRTLRLAQRLVALGVALGGAAGVHLSHQWDLAVSRNTLLRLLRRLPVPSRATPNALGGEHL